ncbi:MAG: T9SS type A sorting domain-containing protein [Bacteroidetes bacterium]|nr:T9SS type A sorting domain-containing protein [Bacteroidota bacterium]MCA6445232.1 T9SS type A sorting domain-containing protein [Bacteroidota bacterium]
MKNKVLKITTLTILLFYKGFSQNIACGGWHSLTICNDSTVKAFGENATGQIGNGNTTDQSIPSTVAGLSGIKAVSAGGDQLEAHSMALKSNGTVWCWGSNLYGALGNASATGTFVTAPVQALLLTNVKAISAGGWHSVALKSDGTVWCWGWNADGQLGDASTVNKIIPTQVTSINNVVKIAAGTYHTLALKSDGTVWAWGDNVNGQIGNSTTGTDALAPVQVNGLTNVVAIAAGRFFSLAVKNDGTVWTWGQNLYGQLGNGNTTDSNTPVQVSGLAGINSAIAAAGAFHCHALKNNGTVWSWGRNTHGNLGNNTVADSNVPVQMTNFSNPVGMAAGTNFSLFFKADGSLWGTGRNASGQLGDGTTTQRNIANQSAVSCSILQNSSTTSLKTDAISDVLIYPNPSSGVYYFKLATELQSGKQITVINNLGQLISVEYSALADNLLSINLKNQPSGIYFALIETEKGQMRLKLIKN